jgi:osmotically-inducible protein OsmY
VVAGARQIDFLTDWIDEGALIMTTNVRHCAGWHNFSFLVLLLLATGCTSLIVGGATPSGNPGGNDGRTASERSSDSRIISKINSRYVHDRQITALDIKVSCYLGVVTLRGHVHSQATADHAASIARGTSGVRQVTSRLVIGRH